MRAVAIRAYGALDQVAVLDLPRPRPAQPGDVVVAVKAAALNHLDLFVIAGLPGVTHAFPHILGCDAAGVVEAVGPGVARVKPGDRVMINPGLSCGRCDFCEAGEQSMCHRFGVLGEHVTGTFAEAVLVPERNLAPLTREVAWAEAAAYPLATLTAYRMLATRAAVRPGETVLIWGIGGGVALAGLQIAKRLGARVIVTSSSDAKLERARSMGADAVVNHRTGDVVTAVRAFGAGRGVNVVLETVGQQTWETSLRCLARGGRVVTCGGTSGHQLSLDVRRLFWHHWTILGSTMGSHREFAEIAHLFDGRRLGAVVDSTFPLAEARSAFERLAAGGQFGKIVLSVEA